MSYRVPQNGLYTSPNIIRVIKSRIMRWEGHVARMADRRGEYYFLIERTEVKIPLGKPKHRWEDNNKIDLEELVWGGVGWIDLAWARDKWQTLINAVMNFRFPLKPGNFLAN
jgi:hypothetical protein